MPRDGSGIYGLPGGYDAVKGVPDATIESADYNSVILDFQTDANTVRPIVAGGTGSSSASGAVTNLGALAISQNLNDVADKPTAWTNIRQPASTAAPGAIQIANNSDVAAASSATLAVTPGAMRQHPGVVKFWVQAGVTGAIIASHGVSSITDNGVGLITVTLSIAFINNSNMCCFGMATNSPNYVHSASPSASAQQFGCRDITGTLSDPIAWWLAGVGVF